MKSTSTYLFAFLLIVLLFACRHEPIENLITQPNTIYKPWEKVDFHKYLSANILSSYATDSMLFTATPYALSVWDKKQKTKFTNFLIDWANQAYNPFPIFSEKIVLTFRDSILDFRSVFYPVTSPNLNLSLKNSDISPNYRIADGLKLGAFSKFYGDKVYFLTFMEHYQNKELVLALIELEYKGESDVVPIKHNKTTIIHLDQQLGQFGNAIRFIGNRFYVSTSYNSYDIDIQSVINKHEIGTNKKVMVKFFEIGKDSVVGISQLNEFFLSTDLGKHWIFTAYSVTDISLSTLKYYRFKNRQFMTNGFNLYEWNLLNNDLYLYDKTGLPESYFVDFHLIKDTLFVTTEGNGVYKKAFKDIQRKQ